MNKTPFLLALLISNIVLAQPKFQNITFQEALGKANTENKLLFLQFEAATCDQCNEVADKGLSDGTIAKRIDEGFVPLLISVDHPDRIFIGQQYNFSSGFGTLFVNPGGRLIHSYHRTSSSSDDYQKQMDLALEKARDSSKVKELEAAYKKGNISIDLIESLLLKRNDLGLTTDELLDEYVTYVPADSLRSTRTLQFIAQMAPVVDSKADKMLRQDRMIFSKAWYEMNQSLRISINNRIIHKSLTNAIKSRNEMYARRVAYFAQSTHSGSPTGAKVYEKNMLRFYKETCDTSNYFKKAIPYYEKYFGTALVDSIKNLDLLHNERMVASTKPDTIWNGNKVIIKRAIRYNPNAQIFTWNLNEAAKYVYNTTNNAHYLSIAIDWATRGLTLYETPEIMDTYSRLLYKQGQKQKAIAMMNNAISLKKEKGFAATEQEAVLKKMRQDQVIE